MRATTWPIIRPTRNVWKRQKRRQPDVWQRQENEDEGAFLETRMGPRLRGAAPRMARVTPAPVVEYQEAQRGRDP